MPKKTIIIVAGVVVIVLAVIGGGFFMLLQQLKAIGSQKAEGHASSSNETEKSEHGGGEHGGGEHGGGVLTIYSLDSFIVNLSDPGGKRYLRVTMGLELSDPKGNDEILKRLPQVRDSIIMILPARKVEDLQSAEGKNALRAEIMAKLNELMGRDLVKKVYFTEFVIQ